MADLNDFADKALWAVASGTVGALVLLWREHYAHRLHVAEKYQPKEGLKRDIQDAVDAAFNPLRDRLNHVLDELDAQRKDLNTILDKFDVPAVQRAERRHV